MLLTGQDRYYPPNPAENLISEAGDNLISEAGGGIPMPELMIAEDDEELLTEDNQELELEH